MSDSEAASADRKIKLLLVEDHSLTRIGLKAALRRTTDLDVIAEASNGQEAIQQADTAHPDVILMDVGMPILDGIQAAKQILEKHAEIKIIMLTQHDNDQDILASLAAGASGYCLKDVEPERLYTAIRSVSAGDLWLDASIAGRVLRTYLSKSPTDSSDAPAENVTQSSPQQNVQNVQKKEALEAAGYAYMEPLSPREIEVLTLIVDGLSNQQIADKLIISLPTAKTHVRNILNKLAVDDRTQAAVQAMRRGLV
jgi:two-component system, NarL family, response regulator LiaR